MLSKSVFQIIAEKRKERHISLSLLEEKTGKDRASIMRWQRGECMVPKKMDSILAELFYDNVQDRKKFIEHCKYSRDKGRKEMNRRRNRRKKMTEASKLFKADLNLGWTSSSDDNEYKYSYASVVVRNKKTGQFILNVCHRTFRFYEDGYSEDGKLPKPLYHKSALEPYMRYCSKNKIGKFALFDLAKREVEKSDMFKVSSPDWFPIPGGKPIIVDSLEIEKIQKFLERAHDYTSVKKLKSDAKDLNTRLDHIRSRASEMPKCKDKLLKSIDNACILIQEKLSDA